MPTKKSSVKGYFRQLTNADDEYRKTILQAIHQYGAPRDYTKAIVLCQGIDQKREEKRKKEEEKQRKRDEKETQKQKERRLKKEEKEKSGLKMKQIEDNMELHIKHLLDPTIIEHKDSDLGIACPICGTTINQYKHVIDIDQVQLNEARDKS